MKIQRIPHKNKMCTATIIACLALSMALATMPMASAAAAITLTPTAQAPGAAVVVAGTGFGATKAIGICLGTEINVTGEDHVPTGSGTGPWASRTLHYPLKPGSFSFHSNVAGTESDWTDNGDGTLNTTSPYNAGSSLNYVTGEFSRSSTADLTGYDIVFTASYTYYQYNVTPAAGVTTLASGAFSASITVPAVPNGNYAVNAIDAGGNRTSQTLSVDSAIPEGLTIGFMVLLSSIAVIVSTRYYRKRPKI